LKADTKQQESIMQYLLGQARPEDASFVEERLVTDSEFYDEVLIAEDELIDQYLSGGLSESERNSFERHFLLTPERQRKVRFGLAFNKYVTAAEPLPDEDSVSKDVAEEARDVAKPPPKEPFYSFLPFGNPILSYSLAAALVLIVGAVSWLALKNWREARPHDPGIVVAVTLTPGLTRSDDGARKITVPSGTGTVELRLELTRDEYVSYRVVLLADDRSEIWRADDLKSRSESGTRFIAARVPVRSLPPGAYRVKLSGVLADGRLEDLPSYQFSVMR
jgi:anti-sigma factor RsiW